MQTTTTTGEKAKDIAANPFISALNEVQTRIVPEKGHDVLEWSRLPMYKKSLVELSFNFIHHPTKGDAQGYGPEIVPEWARWIDYYDPEARNLERTVAAEKHDRQATATVADRPGLVLSSNARLAPGMVQGKVSLGNTFWKDLGQSGYHMIDAYAQWKLPTGADKHVETYILGEIEQLRMHQRGEMSRLLYTLQKLVEPELRECERFERNGTNAQKKRAAQRLPQLRAEAADIRAALNDCDRKVRAIQDKLPIRKGWFRVYLAHKESAFYQAARGLDAHVRNAVRTMVGGQESKKWARQLRTDRKEMEQDVEKLCNIVWGKMIVWNNPSTRTTLSHDIAQFPKIAVQLMNLPKRNGDISNLVCEGGFLSVQ